MTVKESCVATTENGSHSSATHARFRRIVLVGPPGAGKGTQAVRLAETLALPTVVAGDALRHEVSIGSPIGAKASSYMAMGALVPDDLTLVVVQRALYKQDPRRGFILDGFPRTAAQARDLHRQLPVSAAVTDAVELVIDIELVVARLEERLTCGSCRSPAAACSACPLCGGELHRRTDDTPDAIRERLKRYERDVDGVREHYRDLRLLGSVDASAAVEDVTRFALDSLSPHLSLDTPTS